MTMDSAKLNGIVRAVAAPLLAFAAAKGWLVDSESGQLILTALAAVATAIWSVASKRA
jgi:hypothetical protein